MTSLKSQLITLKSQFGVKMLDLFILVSGLLVFTLVIAVLYSKRIREAQEKYVEAKSAVDNIVISFNRQLRRQENRLETSARKIDVLSSRNELFAKDLGDQKKEIQALVQRVESLSALEKALIRIDSLEDKLGKIASTKDRLVQKITEMEKQRLRPKKPEVRIKSAIPIKREKALALLTATELRVLEFLASEGKKTAPEIKEQTRLSREHTARLMKKLYEKGYLERSANKIPFTYRLKEEMQKILKPEPKS